VLGVEPLTEAFRRRLVARRLQRRSSPVKPVLMDSHLVVGIGNIYASESLFRAGISPLRAANRISPQRYEHAGGSRARNAVRRHRRRWQQHPRLCA
jgi:formamidopyrimidine-DNA glycosylase